MSEELQEFDVMASIPKTGDDYEIWACEGALEELGYAYRHEDLTESEKAEVLKDIRRLQDRRHSLVAEVRGGN